MKKRILCLVSLVLLASTSSCGKNEKTINVCASLLPHADVLNGCVKDLLKEKGYDLKVTVLDWTLQNNAVANKDYDANYFQHIPYLENYKGTTELFATCKVHYEPLGIYSNKLTSLESVKSAVICNDTSNAIRAFQLLQNKGVITNIPVEDDKLTFNGSSWTSSNGVTISLIEENLLVTSLADYDIACLPCNTAYTGKVSSNKLITKEDDSQLVSGKANVLAVRKQDYNNDISYKNKIDALTDALLSEEVSKYFEAKYLGAMTCDESTQIDLRK